jgi:hypothetical protein
MKASLRQLLLSAGILYSFGVTQAQNLEQRLKETKPSCPDVFDNAMEVLPELKMTKAFDSMAYVIDFIEKSCDKTTETFNLKVLLAIEQGRFRVEDFYDAIAIHNLETSASNYHNYLINQNRRPKAQVTYYRFTSEWALNLPQRRNLDDNERLICRVLAGIENAPALVVMKNKSVYPYFFDMLHEAKVYERKAAQGIVSISGGYWFPTANMAKLGSHPSFGFQVGQHKNSNEIDLTIQFRFLKSAMPYTVLRSDSLYDLTHFFGGYIGLDYTRYLLKNSDVELGLLVGAGYDGFDISSSDDEDYLKPYSIGSLNVNTGLRFNYFYTSHSFIGLSAGIIWLIITIKVVAR